MTASAPVLDHDRTNPYGSAGVKLAGVTNATEALRLGHLDWKVDVEPIFLADGTQIPGKFATTRPGPVVDGRSTSIPLGVVGRIYEPIQNDWTADLLQRLADTSDGVFQAVGHTHNGARTFVQMGLPEGVSIGGRDRVDLSLIVFNYHDGSGKAVGIPTAIRPACTNQFPSIKRTKTQFTLRHTARAIEVGLGEIRKSIGLTFDYAHEVAEIGGVLVQQPFSQAEFAGLVDVISPVVRHHKTGLELVTSITRREALKTIYAKADNLADVRGTKWGALQAVFEYEDWFRPVRKGTTHESRIVTHAGDSYKRRAQKLLLAR